MCDARLPNSFGETCDRCEEKDKGKRTALLNLKTMNRETGSRKKTRSLKLASTLSALLIGFSASSLSWLLAVRSAGVDDATSDAGETASPIPSPSLSTSLLLPRDILMDSTARMALQALRRHPQESDLYVGQLYHPQSCMSPNEQATLTMIGYKGGSLMEQTNQDRAFVLNHVTTPSTHWTDSYILSGVLDGHGAEGHFVAEWSRHVLTSRIEQGLKFLLSTDEKDDAVLMDKVVHLLNDSFVETDATLPEYIAYYGGATASIALQFSSFIVLANSGDSQSFVVAAVMEGSEDESSKTQWRQPTLVEESVQTIYETRLDKPDDPDEYERLVAAGSEVQLETEEDDARVWYASPITGEETGLAMSRGLGDWGATAVIAEPTMQVLNITEIKQRFLHDFHASRKDAIRARKQECSVERAVDQQSGPMHTCPQTNDDLDDDRKSNVQFFVVSVTDGIIDFLTPQEIAVQLARVLYATSDKENNSLLLTAENILHQSASMWYQTMQGQYRDDMAIAVSKVALSTG